HRDVARRGGAEDGQGEDVIHSPYTALVEDTVLLLGEGEAAKGASEVDAGMLGIALRQAEARIEHRLLCRGDREVLVAVGTPGALGVDVVEGVEVVHLGGHLRPKGRWVEARNALHSRPPRKHALPQPVPPASYRSNGADAGDCYTLQVGGYVCQLGLA